MRLSISSRLRTTCCHVPSRKFLGLNVTEEFRASEEVAFLDKPACFVPLLCGKLCVVRFAKAAKGLGAGVLSRRLSGVSVGSMSALGSWAVSDSVMPYSFTGSDLPTFLEVGKVQ